MTSITGPVPLLGSRESASSQRRFIRFQWKLAGLCAAAVLLTLLAVATTSYLQTKDILVREKGETLRAISSSAAVLVAADFDSLRSDRSDTSARYRHTHETLRATWLATGGSSGSGIDMAPSRHEGITIVELLPGRAVLSLVRSADSAGKDARSWFVPSEIADGIVQNRDEFTATVDSAGEKLLMAVAPIRQRGVPVGYAITSLRTSRVDAELRSNVLSMVQLASLVFFVLAFFAIWFSRRLTKGVNAVSAHTAAIAKGNLRNDLEFVTNDEIGALADSVRSMSGSLRSLLREVDSGASEVAATAEELAASAEEMSASTEEVSTAAQSISTSADRQTQGINMVVAAAAKSAERAQQTSTHARSAQIIADTVGHSAQQGSVSAHQALDSMSNIATVTRDAVPAVNELGEKSARIERLTETIAAIARQTNLLALNAAIEAARAGEHGRGFAVVADEIRKLAADTGKALESIRQLTSEIRDASARTGERITQVSESVSKGEAVIRESSESLAQIAAEINRSREAVLRIVEAADAQQKEADALAREIEKIAAVASDNAVTSQQVSAVVEEQTSSMNHITESSQHLAEIAARLKSSMTRFDL